MSSRLRNRAVCPPIPVMRGLAPRIQIFGRIRWLAMAGSGPSRT
jgi:hypothetical protein